MGDLAEPRHDSSDWQAILKLEASQSHEYNGDRNKYLNNEPKQQAENGPIGNRNQQTANNC